MFPLSLAVFLQDLRATQPTYLLPVVLALLTLGGIGWLIAAVLGFARARAFGPSARWFSYAAVCLIIYHLHWVMFGIVVTIGATQTPPDASSGLGIGAFFNLFIVVGAVCAIMGFIRLTNPR